MKFLVITAYTDEIQYESLCKSLAVQDGVEVIHKVITGKGALSAEKEIYRLANSHRELVDFIIRLDADMVLKRNGLLKFFEYFFDSFPNENRLSLPVADYLTNTQIMGVHCWRARYTPVSPNISPPRPESWIDGIQGRSLIGIFNAYVSHADQPSVSQALRFGMHRAVKAASMGPSHDHWNTLYFLRKNCKRNHYDYSIKAAFVAAICVLRLDEVNWWSAIDKGSKYNIELEENVKTILADDACDRIDFFDREFFTIYRFYGGNNTYLLKLAVKRVRRSIISTLHCISFLAIIFRISIHKKISINELVGDRLS